MIRLSRFRTVQARLLGSMVFIIIPVALMSLALAFTTYRSVNLAIEAAQIQSVSGYAVRTMLWFRGSLRTMVATVTSVRAGQQAAQHCAATVKQVLADIEGYQAIHISFADGMSCFTSKDKAITQDDIAKLDVAQEGKPWVRNWTESVIARARYDAEAIGGKLHLVIHARNVQSDPVQWSATLLIDPVLLDQAFEIGEADKNSLFALMKRGQKVVVARGIPEENTSWLPIKEQFGDQLIREPMQMSSGTTLTFASQRVAEPDLYVLARFDDAASNAALYQFLVLCITPLLTLLLLFAIYARVIQSDVLKWIKGIEGAARIRAMNGNVFAPVDPSMPDDIRLVAEAFNTMVTEGNKREESLRDTLGTNQYLLRELNHRVKNSLQVIQSYLSISRRQRPGVDQAHFVETEAMVQVMSTAYRLALSDGTMRPVFIKPFTEEVIANISSSVRKKDQWIDVQLDTSACLTIDRIIPLGLILVEAIIAGLRAMNAQHMSVHITTTDDRVVTVKISTDGILKNGSPPLRIITGLVAQLEATKHVAAPSDFLHWSFVP